VLEAPFPLSAARTDAESDLHHPGLCANLQGAAEPRLYISTEHMMSGPQSLTIDSTWLHVADGSLSQPDSALVYTITALPQHGTLTIDGTTLAVNGQFTQQQIDDGLLVYADTDPNAVTADTFGFSISDASSQDLGTGTFKVGTSLGTISTDFSGRTMTADTSSVIFFSGPGRNSFTGSADADTAVSYALAPAGVDLVLNGPSGATPSGNGFAFGIDTLVNVHSVIGSAFDDTIWSGPGTNLIFGGAGNDQILGDPTVGDASNTTAGYSGTRSDYLIVRETAVSVKIIDLRPGSPDGVDNVSWVDSFKFSDGTYAFAQLNPISEFDTYGATDVAGIGNNYFLYAHNTGTGPELTYQGSPVTAGEFGEMLGAEPNAGGYEVVWYTGENDSYTAWNVDSNGNYVSTLVGPITERDAAYPSLETTLHQDLNRDRVIGASPVTPLESFGSTTPTKVGGHYYLFANGTSSGPELKSAGSPVLADSFGTLIGAEQTASGYDVAWHNSNGTYTVWSVDSNGNYVSDLITNAPASDIGLQSLEYSLHQDLNGDGVIGVPPIESFGATSLTQIGNDFFLYANGTATGPELKYGGSAWTAGTWGAWTPIGVEATATGYEIAFKIAGGDAYTVWNTDANGNITSNPIATVSGSSLTLEALEVSFHQDLNGDHVIGLPATSTLIEAFGSTTLVQTGSNYFLDKGDNATELHYDIAAFVAGEWGGWTPIGVEATATGYEVAFKFGSADLYTVWDTDSAGNITIDPIGSVSGNSGALAAMEKGFHQDLNGDGMIGNPSIPITIESYGSTSLVLAGNDYFLYANGTSNGPALKLDGAAWTDGTWGGWTPVGAEITATGHEVAFNLSGTNLYTVWNTDSNGNITTNTISTVTAGSTTLQTAEASFHQDLNGDGIIGDPSIPVVVESSGSTSLAQVSDHFFLYDKGTSNGPELKYDGAAWSAGEWGGWTPIAAETTGASYDVAFKLAGSDLYTFWSTDASGNMTGNSLGSVPGSDPSLQSSETLFHQDLNGDGVIGLAAPITAPASGNVTLTGTAAADGFVFHAQFGNDTVQGFQPGQDQVFVDNAVFASINDLFAHTADDAHGNAVVTISAGQSITFDSVSTLTLQQHISNDFHLV
jgi:hypothetical protein